MSDKRPIGLGDNAIADTAALWLARRDRGLTAAEQDEYIQWLAADRRHAEILAQHAAAFERMMKLYEWQPGPSAEGNPDLFAPRSRYQRLYRMIALAAAVAIMAGAAWWRVARPVVPSNSTAGAFLRVNERQALPDGSIAELKDGSHIDLVFSERERRVKLKGEAHFTVAKSSVPFVVQAGSVLVQAVGTAFNVKVDADAIDVLVTHGKVAIQRVAIPQAVQAANTATNPIAASSGDLRPSRNDQETPTGSYLIAGQRAVVPSSGTSEIDIRQVSTEETQVALGWKAPRLQFFETPLGVAVEEFNRWNRVKLVLEHRELGAVPIGGTFRIDNVESFVRLIEVTLEINAVRRSDETIVLTRKRAD